jgi:endoglucanase
MQIPPYGTSTIAVRVHTSDWSPYHQRGDYSFKADGQLGDWDRVGLYRDGKLVWGTEPVATAERAG